MITKDSNPRHDHDLEDYKECAGLLLEATGAAECYDEEIIEAAWNEGRDYISAAFDCKNGK